MEILFESYGGFGISQRNVGIRSSKYTRLTGFIDDGIFTMTVCYGEHTCQTPSPTSTQEASALEGCRYVVKKVNFNLYNVSNKN